MLEGPVSQLTQDEVDTKVKDAINATFPFGKPNFDRKALVSLSVEINRAFDGNLTPKLVPMIRNSLSRAGYSEWTGGFKASLRS
jgi:hypothetical protein